MTVEVAAIEIAAQAYQSFIPPDEQRIIDAFMQRGMLIAPAEDAHALELLRDFLVYTAAKYLELPQPRDAAQFLNTIHRHVSVAQLNAFRVQLIAEMKIQPWFRVAYFATARRYLETIIGNELVMQRAINLSIQLPHDESSLLALHADAWSGDSPYEIVLWIPYVDCYRTKSMYFTDQAFDAAFQQSMAEHKRKSAEQMYAEIQNHVEFLDIPFGSVLLFTQNIMHGNRINSEDESRWSSNCRFKSALSPYADKKLLEFFEPISLRPATTLGHRYQLPQGFA